jgi:thiol:disulfide interchange protein
MTGLREYFGLYLLGTPIWVAGCLYKTNYFSPASTAFFHVFFSCAIMVL